MDLGTTLVADTQAAEVVQMVEAALDAAAGDQWPDAAPAQEPTVLIVVVAAVGQQAVGFAPRPPALAFDRARVPGVQERQQLRVVVAVAAGQGDRQRHARAVGQEVML